METNIVCKIFKIKKKKITRKGVSGRNSWLMKILHPRHRFLESLENIPFPNYVFYFVRNMNNS
jgi:hypothetical protein